MKLLYIDEDGGIKQKDLPNEAAISQEDLQNIDEGVFAILRVNPETGDFEVATVSSEEIEEDSEDEELESEAFAKYGFASWQKI